ncbi:hypothetical protein SO694_00047138 [Aureococcus anophagefferens]|uniref:Uncharacterized protein n=1 Tax=Aureococcus anophagefferens TaxID=44056 RepID=A0ABR1G816_AURAN
MFGVLARNAFILAELKKQKQGCLLRDGHGASVDADLVAALDGLRLSKRCYRKLRDLNPKGQGFCALALESADLSTITDVSGYVEKGLEKGTLLRRGRELMGRGARRRSRRPAARRRAGAAPSPRRQSRPGVRRAAAGAGFAVVVAPSAVPAARRRPRSDSAARRPRPGAGPGLDAASHEPAPAPLWSREDPPGSPPPPHADVPPLFAAAGAWSPEPEAQRPATSAWDWLAPAAPAPAPAPAFDGAYDDDDDFVVPEGLVDVERRSNCSLDAIVAVLHRCATFAAPSAIHGPWSASRVTSAGTTRV